MSDLTKLTAEELAANLAKDYMGGTAGSLLARDVATLLRPYMERLEQCEAELRKARTLLISEGDHDEDAEMIAEIDELLGNAARSAVEEK